MSKIKIGIIGTGYMGGTHAQLYARNERTEVHAVYDIRPERMQRVSKQTGARCMENGEQVIELCDAIIVTTPNSKHTALTIAAANAGKAVFSEKPMATNLTEAQAVLEASKNARTFQVGHNRRFAPVYVKLKELIAEDNVHSAHTIHLFDMIRFQFGEVAEMIAFGSSRTYPETDNFSVLLKFKNGLHATFCSAADASWIFPFERIEAFCEHRTIMTQEMENLTDSRGTDANFQFFSWHLLSKEERWGYQQENEQFISAILNETEPPVTAFDGYKSVELVEACYKAVKTGERIKFE